ncbi:RagB/SusD family nutrient uptake outer membrane protein [Mucilaginibacter terrigena]|uniref:RagB/SusD family nutrient uptake outer membrane protein n=1 Tax=Mucilaginibacter terrigena TaxID=2492395 RepID=A0A4Q5LQG6_9SPHI|nr:RagB/SusD family nutrient uptake outer membrane protein [Mucilaginibacter terrigena]RYU91589.1 RagB/SusD family nutrient uptake outer membrane protein [Mucilaginibacter terrigena]
MKFNFKKLRICLLLILTITASSCKKYLDEERRDNFNTGNYFTTASQAKTFVNGIYANLYMFQNGDAYGESPFITLELFAGHTTTLGQSVNNKQVINQSTSPTNPGFETVWSNSYAAIANANVALKRIPEITMPDADKKKLLGEVYFLRAFFYYHLVRLYGDVPLITEPVTITSETLYPERSPVAAVYDLIVADLKAAKDSGMPETDQTGRASIGAVRTLLGSVYLTMAGYPLKKIENYALAAAEVLPVLSDYTLFDKYDYLHDNAHKNQGELIFQINYLVGIKENAIPQLTLPFNLQVGSYGDHLGAMIPTDEFVASYPAGDLRTEERQFYFSSYPKDKDPGTIIQFGEHALYKYFHVESALGNGKSDENWTLLRLPEAMLIYAEAQNEADGSPNSTSRDAINAIRNRAHLAPIGALSQSAFREEVWQQRYHELAYENKAYFDMQRTHKRYDVATHSFPDATTGKNEQDVTFKEQYYLWPIPQREMNTNPKLTQNPGWQ